MTLPILFLTRPAMLQSLSGIFLLLVFLGGNAPVFSQATTTNLTKPEDIQTFVEATSRIRCICLPSLPIQACSYNMCAVSSYLKNFIENRIRSGMKSDEIVQKFQTGFGESPEIQNDPVILHFQEQGNTGMIQAIQFGFGENIQAKPDSTAINLTLGLGSVLALAGIFFYLRRVKSQAKTTLPEVTSSYEAKSQILQEKYKDII